MIGFEAELDVPIFQNIDQMASVEARGEPGAKTIYSFLFGGHETTDVAITGNDDFTIKPDVSGFPGQQLFDALASIDPTFADQRPLRAGKPMPVSIRKIEYITSPINEMDPTADDTYKRQAGSIKRHLEDFGPQAAQKIFRLPGTECYVGIPVEDIQNLIGKAQNSAQASQANQALANVQLKVQQHFALQATAGIFPSIIPELFRTRKLDQPSPKLRQAWEIAFPMIDTFVQNVFDNAKIKKDAWTKDLIQKDLLRAFRGHLYLLSSYVVGDALSESTLFENTSGKNAVPYHAKINLGYVYKAMPESFAKPDVDLEEELIEEISSVLTECNRTRTDSWLQEKFGLEKREIKGKERREHLVLDAHIDFVKHALVGEKVQTLINQFLGRSPDEKAHELEEPDALPPSRTGEKGVQLEFRRLGMNEVAPDKLAEQFIQIVNTVRDLNKPRMT
jgi:hypothetical protein